jgi:hypothetical protein
MISSSKDGVASGGPALCVLAALAVMTVGCSPAPQITPAVFKRPTRGNNPDAGTACLGTNGQEITATMDAYVVQVFDVITMKITLSDPPNSLDCQKCLGTPEACLLEHPQVCLCSAPLAATDLNLSMVMKGFRVENLDTNDKYCTRVLAIDTGAVRAGPPTPCPCNTAWLDNTDGALARSAQLCALSAPIAVGTPFGINLDLRCPGDGVRMSGGGQNNNNINNSPALIDCVVPPTL